MPTAEATAALTDQELGIGVDDDEGVPDPLAALLSDPRMAAALDAAVAARIAQMGTAPAPTAAVDTGAFAAFTETIKHLIDTNAQQQPGYTKPLPAEEVDRRAAGRVEMFALLDHYKRLGLAPAWIVGEGGFFECNNAQEFKQGDRIRMYLPPPEDFEPDNEPAARVKTALMQWLGGPTPSIGEQVEAAEKAAIAKQGPIITGALQPSRVSSAVELVEAAPVTPAPSRKRVMGTLTPERRDISLADRAAGPQGPTFVNDAVAA